jgi:hypothetical protein
LTNDGEVKGNAQPGTFIAHLFIRLMFEVSGIMGDTWFGSIKAATAWIILESIHKNVPLVAICYRYSSRTTLFFVAMKDAGITKKGNSYEMKYTDDWGNVHVCYVDRPEIISKFVERSNMIDKNQVHQSELALEKCWLTHNPYFRLHTTILGFTVVDCYKLAEHHDIINHRLPHNKFK